MPGLVHGTDLLESLFERNPSVFNNTHPDTLEPTPEDVGQFTNDLEAINAVLNVPKEQASGELAYLIHNLVADDNVGALQKLNFNSDDYLAKSYASGIANAAAFYCDPFSASEPPTEISTSYGSYLIGKVKATRAITVGNSGNLDPVSALEDYLYAVNESIPINIITRENEILKLQSKFKIGPQIGLSLVAFGDAMMKCAQTEPQRASEYSNLARAAYTSSGFAKTVYVSEKLKSVGELPQANVLADRPEQKPLVISPRHIM